VFKKIPRTSNLEITLKNSHFKNDENAEKGSAGSKSLI